MSIHTFNDRLWLKGGVLHGTPHSRGACPVLSRSLAGAPSWEPTSNWVTSGRRGAGSGHTLGAVTDWEPSDSLA